MGPIQFLKLFHPRCLWLLFAISPVDRSRTEARTFGPDSEDAARRFIEQYNGKWNLYFAINSPRQKLDKKSAREDIAEVRWFHVDVDARVGEPLEDELRRIKSRLATPPPGVPPPTCIIFSGNGYWAFWRLATPIVVNGDLQLAKELARYNQQLEVLFGGDACSNVDRVARLPGTTNIPDINKLKKGRARVAAEVYLFEQERMYDVARFTQVVAPQSGSVDVRAAVSVDPSDISSISSVDDLDEWKVDDRTKVIIVQGHHPDEEPKPSRSEWLFDVCCQLARRGVPDKIVMATITNPDFKISDSVLEKGNKATEYAERQVERAKEEVAKDPSLLSKHTPKLSAHEFIRRCRPTLIHYNDDCLAFDGAAYRELEDETIKSEVYDFLDRAYEPGDPPKPFAPNKSKVVNVIDALESAAHKPRDTFAPPCWLEGAGPPPLEIVVCRNGLLHLPTGELHPLTSRFFTRNALEFDYQPDAPATVRWLEFLAQLWPGESDIVETLQEVFGYLLVPDTAQQKMFMFVGPTRSGKGTVARVLTHLVGKHNTCAPTLKSMGDSFGLEALIGKQLAIVSDVRLGTKSDHASIAENLLRISGEDMVTANRKYKRAWDGKLAVRFLVMTNQMPQFADASGALANRFVPLVMRQSFLGREDPGLLAKLRPELPGILNWAVVGWKRLQERGHFVLPASSREAVSHLSDLASPEAAFIRDECDLAPDAVVPKHDLYAAFKAWCGRSGDVSSGTPEVFSSRLQAAANGRVDTTKPREGDRRVPSFRGIRLRNDHPF